MSIKENLDLKVVDKLGDVVLEAGCLLWDALSTGADGHQSSETVQELQQKAPLRILVSSKVLTIGSPVFEKMLHGRFAEGQHHFNQENPPTVSLPEDDPQATLLFCEIIHCSRGVHHFKGYKALHELGIFAEKYMCTNALRSWFRSQLSRFGRDDNDCFDTESLLKGDISVPQMLKLCYVINDADLFALASKTFYTHINPAEIHSKLEEVYEDEVPARLIELLCAFGKRYINDLAEVGPALLAFLCQEPTWYGYFAPIPTEPDPSDPNSNDSNPSENGFCFGETIRIGIVSATLVSLSLLPCSDPEVNSRRSPGAMLRKLQRVRELDFRDEKLNCPKELHCQRIPDPYLVELFDKEIKAANQRARGICLGCAKDETVSVSDIDILQDSDPCCERHASWCE
ncbi:uncharacterized protein Z520_00139 [Fonsecaea multimorphosa CBS 102226]|uniref:BTB domain-containing protein n=1 Tax=Fonsecaea multimorphosa CBS 102226 TaxID=1442371 RepID=A0A0D2KBN1_9EURO|nr:uncharacterized protein Z520_00139 [Fonsecaea multimorphosa CBS 102226]KIY03448.1 hypothetical protein Z520_00139 [Fonsecaea multimorphosa CBS 102226]OAL32854.1 hypothetical protein AYO22_00180 [Fonsecaea multimorphosa]